MILRRISEHVRTQNWTAIALDFLIVVTGVFIGVQMSNWNDSRAEAARADELRARLAEDFGVIAEDARESVSRVTLFIETAEEVYADLLAGARPEDEKAFGQRVNLAGSSHPPAGESPTFAEMLSTGDIGLIKDKELRAALIEYHQWAEQNRRLSDVFLPLFLQHVEALDRYIIWSRLDPETGFPTVVEVDFEAMTGEPEIFRRIARLNTNLLQVYTHQLKLAETVLSELGEDVSSP